MNKLKLSALLLGGALSANAQFKDTSSNDYVTYPPQDTLKVSITKDTIKLFGGIHYEIENKWMRAESEIIYVGPEDLVMLDLYTNIPNDSCLVHFVEEDHYHEYLLSCSDDIFVIKPQSVYYKIIVFESEIDSSNTNIYYQKVTK
tara:strand:+ start:560 stop:994 length:435 start_codon:yes stop_codon:yes gene_type:complete